MTYEEDARVADPTDPNGNSNAPEDMRLARVYLVQIATPRKETDQVATPAGFVPIWGGEASARVLALDRDRLGTFVRPLDLAALLVHPGPGPAPGWKTGP